MFGLAGRLFGVSITPADGEAEVWNPDVRFFNIKDTASGGEPSFDRFRFLSGDPTDDGKNGAGGGCFAGCPRLLPVCCDVVLVF